MQASPTRSAKLENQFVGEGYYDLCLRIGELIALQEKLGVGPNVAAQRLLAHQYLVEDVIETIRLGLIGGGMPPQQAFELVNRTVCPGYIGEYAMLAASVLIAAVHGVEEEPVPDLGEAEAPMSLEVTPDISCDGDHFSNSEGPQDSHPAM